jgi:hypothetical protein
MKIRRGVIHTEFWCGNLLISVHLKDRRNRTVTLRWSLQTGRQMGQTHSCAKPPGYAAILLLAYFSLFPTCMAFFGEGLVVPQSFCTTPCRLSVAAYSVYSQLPFIYNDRVVRMSFRHVIVTQTHLKWAASTTEVIYHGVR